ncbi:unnamed protein product [Ectocarpus sp. CCAP 1310/34]|nr:unnamed protein product [Ectocarpus sp. CCAP 1310/34]
MFSCRLMKVNGVLLPEVLGALGGEGQLVAWKVHLRHGSQEHRAQFTALPSSKNNSTTPSLSEPRRTDLVTISGSPSNEEVEFEDKGVGEKVEVAVLFDLIAREMPKRQLFRHSIASIDLDAFRAQPEKRVELWLPLQPVNSGNDLRDYGSIQISIMYTDDCVTQGYMFGLFCGLTLPRLSIHPS